MFTPQEVSEKTFPKSARFSEGYQMASVDEFLDSLTEDYTALFKDNVALKAKLKVLAEKIEEYRSTEDSMRATLVTAQKMAAKLVQEAQIEKDSMIAEARRNAAVEIAQLDAQTEQARRKLALAQQDLAEFVSRSNELMAKHQAFLTSLPEMDLAQPREEKITDTVSDIGAEIRKAFAEEKAVPVEEEAPEVPEAEELPVEPVAAEPVMGSAIPSDFTLSLDELKFGRNYSGNSEE